LFNLLLGTACFPRLTILVVPVGPIGSGHSASIAAELEAPDSIFHPAHKAGARIMISNLDEPDIINILEGYATKDPLQLQIQRDRPDNLRNKIETTLGYCETDSVKLLLTREAESVARTFRPRLATLQSSLEESNATAKHYHSACQQLEQDLARHQEAALKLRQQLKQTQTEYSSLRSQLQLQENIEQSEVVQGLKDLNRNIDDIGRSFSEYLVDQYVKAAFDKDPGDVTTLDAQQLSGLQELFGHIEGRTSLVMSSSGTGMMIEDFFDYGIRCLLCVHLSQRIFGIFHPAVEPSHNKLVADMYDDIQKRGTSFYFPLRSNLNL
jgi:hypothetical protein